MTQPDDTIFLLNDEGNLQRVPRCHYESEDLLQTLIEKYPDLLAGDQMGGDESVRFILVKREAGIPDGDGNCDRWSIDHILLDQFGVPTLVEVKRSSDTRIRREAVGQLLEYAANIDIYWPSNKIRSLAVEQHGGADELDRAIIDLLCLDPETDVSNAVENYWLQVEDNFRNGKLRLLFVADELPREVRRIIEFLNSKMTGIEVLGVELRQYVGNSLRAMVPRIIGQTEAIRRTKNVLHTPVKHTTQNDMLTSCPADVQPFISDLLKEASNRGITVYWGLKGFSLRAADQASNLHSVFYCYPPGVNGPLPIVEGYLPPVVRGTDLSKFIEESLLNIAGFKKSGQYTFRLNLSGETLHSAQQSLEVIWKATEMLQSMPVGGY
jgi:hypothetical protein